MDNPELVQLLQRSIRDGTSDIKAECQLAIALEKGLTFDNFFISCDSLFLREYSKDVVLTELREDARKLSILQLHLSRSGISDQLPEGIIFKPSSTTTKQYSVAEMVQDHRANRQKEQETRRFFQPFENDFFWQRLQLEIEEVKLLEGLQSGILNEYFVNFWGIPDSVPRVLIVPFILLLPYANEIAGDLSLTSRCLEKLIKEKVEVKKVRAPASAAGSFFNQLMGEQTLGVDMVCGEQFVEDYPVLDFTIGPLQASGVTDYLEGGKYAALLQTFYRFFVPVGVDTITNVEVMPEQKSMHLETGNEPVLGYSSVLG